MTRLPVLTDLQHAMTAGYEERTGALCDETKFLTDIDTGGRKVFSLHNNER